VAVIRMSMANEFTFQFLRFLAMPRRRQEAYLATASKTRGRFAYEGRDGCYVGELGLDLLLVVGTDYLIRLDQQSPPDDDGQLHRLWSILFLLTEYCPECGPAFTEPWPEDGEIRTWVAGVWNEIQALAATVLSERGVELSEPDVPIEALAGQVCDVVHED